MIPRWSCVSERRHEHVEPNYGYAGHEGSLESGRGNKAIGPTTLCLEPFSQFPIESCIFYASV